MSDSYFPSTINSSKLSTPATTPSSTPALKPQDSPAGTPHLSANMLPVFLRDFPKPAEDVDVKAMLERHPGRWTIQGQIEANQRRAKPEINAEELREKRAREFEAAKRDLLAARGNLG